MENTTDKKKSSWWIGLLVSFVVVFGGAGLIVFFLGGSPYQKRLAEIKNCIQQEYKVDVVYIKDLPKDASAALPFETREVFKAFNRETLPALEKRVPMSVWSDYRIDCASMLDMNTYFISSVRQQAGKGQTVYVIDLYNEKTERFEDAAYQARVNEEVSRIMRQASEELNKELKKMTKDF